MDLIFYIALALTVFLVLALLLAPMIMRPSAAARRLLETVQSTRPDRRKVGQKERVQETILSAAKAFRSQFGLAEDTKVKQRLLRAGFKSSQSTDAYFACRLAAPMLGIIGGSFIRQHTLFWSMALGATFYLVPDTWLRAKIKKRTERIRKGIPDALDLLVICVEAGLGLDQAMLRVGQELTISHPDINGEFKQINLEQLAGKPRLDAWKSAAERTQIEEFSLFVTMLTQSDQFGTPIIKALSRFSDEIRLKRRQRAEEMAAKTRIKILFPLVLFIFPCIFVVLLAPALLNIAKSMQLLK